MLLSSYVFDLVMEILYVLFFTFNTYKPSLLLDAIILSKLLGSLFAWVEYKDDHIGVLIIGIVVLILNIICYVVYFLKLKGVIKVWQILASKDNELNKYTKINHSLYVIYLSFIAPAIERNIGCQYN